MYLMKEKQGGPIPTGLKRWPLKLVKHLLFDLLSSLSDPESPIPDIIGPPSAASSPIVQETKEAKEKAAKAALNHPLRILIMNCQAIKNKKAELYTIINSAKPDIILGN